MTNNLKIIISVRGGDFWWSVYKTLYCVECFKMAHNRKCNVNSGFKWFGFTPKQNQFHSLPQSLWNILTWNATMSSLKNKPSYNPRKMSWNIQASLGETASHAPAQCLGVQICVQHITKVSQHWMMGAGEGKRVSWRSNFLLKPNIEHFNPH